MAIREDSGTGEGRVGGGGSVGGGTAALFFRNAPKYV